MSIEVEDHLQELEVHQHIRSHAMPLQPAHLLVDDGLHLDIAGNQGSLRIWVYGIRFRGLSS